MMHTPQTLSYRPPHLQLDLWKPQKVPKALVVYAHGGGFVHGDRHDRVAKVYGPIFADQGIAFATISYRRGGAPRRAFDKETFDRIKLAAQESTAFYPSIRPALFGAYLYRAATDFSFATQFLLSEPSLALTKLPWIAMGNSSGGLAALAVSHGLAGMELPTEFPRPIKAIAIASIVPQPQMLTATSPATSLLCARGDTVFPREEVTKLESHIQAHDLPVSINRIPYGQHTRPVRELMPGADGELGKWGTWLLSQITSSLAHLSDITVPE